VKHDDPTTRLASLLDRRDCAAQSAHCRWLRTQAHRQANQRDDETEGR